jgi:hypothetical protein
MTPEEAVARAILPFIQRATQDFNEELDRFEGRRAAQIARAAIAALREMGLLKETATND